MEICSRSIYISQCRSIKLFYKIKPDNRHIVLFTVRTNSSFKNCCVKHSSWCCPETIFTDSSGRAWYFESENTQASFIDLVNQHPVYGYEEAK